MKFYKYKLSKYLSTNNSFTITDILLPYTETLNKDLEIGTT